MDSIVDELSAKLCLTATESQKLKAPSSVWNTAAIDYKLCLVGRVLQRKPVNLGAFQTAMFTGWNLPRDVTIQKVGEDRVLYQFMTKDDKDSVLRKGPSAFDRNLVVLSPVQENEDPLQTDLNSTEFFVQATGLPIMLMHCEMAEFLGGALGDFVAMDNSSRFVGLRFKAKIDITKPLRRVIQAEGPKNEVITVKLAYERLPNFCYFCGILGHLVKDCHECVALTGPLGKVPGDNLNYDEWLRGHVNNQQPRFVNDSLSRVGRNPISRSSATNTSSGAPVKEIGVRREKS
ncbi:hypothetical protein OROMI_020661 [Orobanche minor]